MVEQGLFDWDFKATSHTRFELMIQMLAHNRLLVRLLGEAKKKLKKKKGMKVDDTGLDKINRFDIPPQYLRLVATTLSKTARKIEKEVKKDGIEVLKARPAKAWFQRVKGEHWVVTVVYEGDYVDKR